MEEGVVYAPPPELWFFALYYKNLGADRTKALFMTNIDIRQHLITSYVVLAIIYVGMYYLREKVKDSQLGVCGMQEG